MSKYLVVLHSQADRSRLVEYANKAPLGSRIELKPPRRSLPQNDRLWLMLTAVSKQLLWRGDKYSPEEWKDYFMHALRGEKWMPAEDGGMVPIGRSTSDLGKEDFGDLMELIEAFASRQKVYFPWTEVESPPAKVGART